MASHVTRTWADARSGERSYAKIIDPANPVNLILDLPLGLRVLIVFVLGAAIGGQLNRGIYRLAWDSRLIGPWSPPHRKAPPRRWYDRLPVIGWYPLRREGHIHGPYFWVRPMLIELAVGAGFAALYGWMVQGGLIPGVAGINPVARPLVVMYHAVFLSHALLIALMVVATFIDFDEKTIPDAITVPGTLAALVLAAALPMSRLPVVVPTLAGPVLSHLRLTTPHPWPTWLDGWGGLVSGIACFGAWCFAILPWLWTMRRGWKKALVYFVVSITRHVDTARLAAMALAGSGGIVAVWWHGGAAWESLLSALVGLAFGGGLLWGVRTMGSAALGQEAMGFGDVTLMSMIGAFVGWQPVLVIFFLAPFAALLIAVAQWLLTARKDIAFGPYLCLSTLVLILGWKDIWNGWADGIFALGWYIPQMVGVCLLLMGGGLLAWRTLKERLFGPA